MYQEKKKIKIPSPLQSRLHLGPKGAVSAWSAPATRAVQNWARVHATPCACELATGFFLHQVGTNGQLVFLLSSAFSLGHFEKIGDVQQCLANVVPKALGIRLRT